MHWEASCVWTILPFFPPEMQKWRGSSPQTDHVSKQILIFSDNLEQSFEREINSETSSYFLLHKRRRKSFRCFFLCIPPETISQWTAQAWGSKEGLGNLKTDIIATTYDFTYWDGKNDRIRWFIINERLLGGYEGNPVTLERQSDTADIVD